MLRRRFGCSGGGVFRIFRGDARRGARHGGRERGENFVFALHGCVFDGAFVIEEDTELLDVRHIDQAGGQRSPAVRGMNFVEGEPEAGFVHGVCGVDFYDVAPDGGARRKQIAVHRWRWDPRAGEEGFAGFVLFGGDAGFERDEEAAAAGAYDGRGLRRSVLWGFLLTGVDVLLLRLILLLVLWLLLLLLRLRHDGQGRNGHKNSYECEGSPAKHALPP